MSKEVITYACMDCDGFFSLVEPSSRANFCPYCGADETSQYSFSKVEEGAEQ